MSRLAEIVASKEAELAALAPSVGEALTTAPAVRPVAAALARKPGDPLRLLTEIGRSANAAKVES